MKTKKITQEKAVFYMLWKAHQTNPEEYIPAWKFVGEIYIEELGVWFFMSYKCPANGVNVYLKNSNLIERRETRGRTGAKYYEYRIAPNPSVEKINEDSILQFYKELKRGKELMELRSRLPVDNDQPK